MFLQYLAFLFLRYILLLFFVASKNYQAVFVASKIHQAVGVALYPTHAENYLKKPAYIVFDLDHIKLIPCLTLPNMGLCRTIPDIGGYNVPLY